MHLIIIIIGRLRSPTDAAACPMARSSSVDISMWRLYQRDAEGSIAYITSWQISSQHVIVATANLARWNVRAVTSEVTLWRQRWRTVELWVGVTCNWIDQRARSLARQLAYVASYITCQVCTVLPMRLMIRPHGAIKMCMLLSLLRAKSW